MKKTIFFEILLVFIITVPAFSSILNNQFFSMHDDQHIARLYLLDQGIKQGVFYPRWVSGLGFNYGYPLFNFYPPLVYYIAEVFHLIGFSFIWSIKLTFILGFFVSSLGIYLFAKKLFKSHLALLSSVFYTYFLYHAVNIYVRGALAEFFSMAIIPFVFLSLIYLSKKISIKNSIFFGITFSMLILTHPLIAFPSLIFIGFFVAFYIFSLKNKIKFIKYLFLGLLVGLALSSFFWSPSLLEKKYTMVDNILTKELANYKLHYIYPSQFIYSNWGYGGSVEGANDGMSFQLGKVYIFFTLFAVFLSFIYFIINKKSNIEFKYFLFFLLLLVLSLFMTTAYSSFVWDNIKYLWYMQFPWRFLTFAGFFISIVSIYPVFFLKELFQKNKFNNYIFNFLIILLGFSTILIYQKYYKPQRLINADDKILTSFSEISWRISRSSFEFIPKGVKTTRSDLNTTIPTISQNSLPKSIYEIISGKIEVETLKNNFEQKEFIVKVESNTKFRLNTFNFHGWEAKLDNKKIRIDDKNDLKLITVDIPKGNYDLKFTFKDTNVRKIANIISLVSLVTALIFLFFNFASCRKIN